MRGTLPERSGISSAVHLGLPGKISCDKFESALNIVGLQDYSSELSGVFRCLGVFYIDYLTRDASVDRVRLATPWRRLVIVMTNHSNRLSSKMVWASLNPCPFVCLETQPPRQVPSSPI